MLNPIEINFKLDKTINRALTTELMIKSHDINVIEFHISFDGLELTADHTVKVLSVFNDTESQTNVNCDIVDGKAIYRPDTSIISQYEHAQNYVYLYHGDQSLDVQLFTYSVDLSQIDKTALKVKTVYDQSYDDLLADFEAGLQDYKDSLPQSSDLRAEVDVVLDKFKVDSVAKLSQYDADAQQVITDNQTAFDLEESGRQATYEQAETSRNQASEQAVSDFAQTADAQKNAKLSEIQADADSAINQFKQDGANEIADWRGVADYELSELAPQIANLTTQLADKVQNFKIKNEVVNGDFSQGTTGWSALGSLSIDDVSGNKSAKIATQGASSPYYVYQNIVPFVINDKFYYSVKIKLNNALSFPGNYYGLRCKSGSSGNLQIRINSSDVSGTTTKMTALRIADGTETGIFAVVYDGTNVVSINVDDCLVLNLTKIFGAGNEPTKLEMDELVNVIPNQWWDGELTITQKQFITWQLNLIRKNTNALIALGGTII